MMRRIITYIIAVLFALSALLVLGLFVVSDIRSTADYLKAKRIMARVSRLVGEKKTANYGILQPPTTYYTYAVDFMVDGRQWSGIFLSRKNVWKEGDLVEIRYKTNQRNEIEIVNQDIKDRFVRFMICVVIVVPLCLIAIKYF